MAKFDLRPNENILFPNPYLEDEKNPLVVTTLRVVFTGEGKKQELEAAKVTYTSKGNNPQIMKTVVLLFVLALPFLIFGAYKYITYRNKQMDPPAEVKGAPPSAFSRAQIEQFASNKKNFIVGVVGGVFGAALGAGAYLLYTKKRFMVVVGGTNRIMRIPVKDAVEQDKLLSMVGAAQTSAKAMAPLSMPQKVVKPPAK